LITNEIDKKQQQTGYRKDLIEKEKITYDGNKP
jgi:hypothetical protein